MRSTGGERHLPRSPVTAAAALPSAPFPVFRPNSSVPCVAGRARESLRQCLQWVTQQGPIVDAGQLAQLLKGQIEVHSIATQAGCGPSEDTPSRLVDHELVAAEGVAEDSSLQGLLSPERSTVAGGTAMEETPEAGARKRRAGDDAFLLEDERLLQALPAVWPGRKMARRSVTMSMEPKLPILHSD